MWGKTDVRGVRKVHVTYKKENGGQDGAVEQLRRDGDNFLQGKDQLPRRSPFTGRVVATNSARTKG